MIEDWLAGLEADCSQPAGLDEFVLGDRAVGGGQAKSGEGIEDDTGEPVEIVQDEGEGADIKDLAQEAGEHIVFTAQCPEQTRQRDVDGNQNAGQEGDIATEQPEPGIDVAGEGIGEPVDDGEVVHHSRSADGSGSPCEASSSRIHGGV